MKSQQILEFRSLSSETAADVLNAAADVTAFVEYALCGRYEADPTPMNEMQWCGLALILESTQSLFRRAAEAWDEREEGALAQEDASKRDTPFTFSVRSWLETRPNRERAAVD